MTVEVTDDGSDGGRRVGEGLKTKSRPAISIQAGAEGLFNYVNGEAVLTCGPLAIIDHAAA